MSRLVVDRWTAVEYYAGVDAVCVISQIRHGKGRREVRTLLPASLFVLLGPAFAGRTPAGRAGVFYDIVKAEWCGTCNSCGQPVRNGLCSLECPGRG